MEKIIKNENNGQNRSDLQKEKEPKRNRVQKNLSKDITDNEMNFYNKSQNGVCIAECEKKETNSDIENIGISKKDTNEFTGNGNDEQIKNDSKEDDNDEKNQKDKIIIIVENNIINSDKKNEILAVENNIKNSDKKNKILAVENNIKNSDKKNKILAVENNIKNSDKNMGNIPNNLEEKNYFDEESSDNKINIRLIEDEDNYEDGKIKETELENIRDTQVNSPLEQYRKKEIKSDNKGDENRNNFYSLNQKKHSRNFLSK